MWDYIDPNYDNSVDSEWYLGEPLYRRNDPAPDIEHEDLAVHAESPPRVLPQLHGEPSPYLMNNNTRSYKSLDVLIVKRKLQKDSV